MNGLGQSVNYVSKKGTYSLIIAQSLCPACLVRLVSHPSPISFPTEHELEPLCYAKRAQTSTREYEVGAYTIMLIRCENHPPSGKHVRHVKQLARRFGVNERHVTVHAEPSLLGALGVCKRICCALMADSRYHHRGVYST
jgi:hypothetical protein